MDLSKLPKLSETPKPADNSEPMPGLGASGGQLNYRNPGTREPDVPISGGEIWFASIVGLIFIFLSRNFPSWLFCKLTGNIFSTGVNWVAGAKAGQPVAYWELQGHTALSDMSIFLFGLAVIIEALMYFVWLKSPVRLKGIAWMALAVTVLATGFNLITSVVLLSEGIMPLMSMLAAAFGGWMFVQQLGLLSWIGRTQQNSAK